MSRSTFRAEVSVYGANEAAERIMAMGARAYATAPLMEQITEDLFEISRKRVQQAPYTPLTEGTIARKSGQGEDTGIFKDEWRPIAGTPTRVGNALYTALTVQGAPGQVWKFTRASSTFGVDSAGQGSLFYARFVQNVKGTKRRILAISTADAIAITERVGMWISSPEVGHYRLLR